MKQTTKRILGVAAVSTLVVGLASGVFARGGFGPGFGPGWGGHHGMMGGPGGMYGPMGGPGSMMTADPVAAVERNLGELKNTLGINSAQETVWNAYAEAVKGKAGLMLSHRQTMQSAEGVLPEQYLAFHQQGLEQMQKITTATQDLYAVLTPEQHSKASALIGTHAGPRWRN